MPIMPVGERVLCGSAAWGVFARRLVLPWALGSQALSGDVLEIGGGGGAMAIGMLTRFPAIQLTVADVDPLMVEVTRTRLAQFGSRATVTLGDATDLPFDDGRFDVVVSFLMLHHIGAWETAVTDVVRVLRPGGRFIGYDLADSAFSRGFHHLDSIHDLRSITAPALRTVLTEAGVDDLRIQRARSGVTLRWAATKPR